MALLPPVVLELRAKAGEVFTELGKVQKEMSKTEKESSHMDKALEGAGKAGSAISLGIAGAAVAVGGFSVEAATSASVVESKLATAIKNAGGSYEKLKPQIDAVDASERQYGFTNDQTNQALATLTTATKSPTQAMKDMSIAANLARMKNMDLNSAALLVAKTSEGQSRALVSLGIQLPIVSSSGSTLARAQQTLARAQQKVNAILHQTPSAVDKASKAHKSYEAALGAVRNAQQNLTQYQQAGGQMLNELSKRVSGTAAAYGKTLPGEMKTAEAGLDNIGETIGGHLIPIIQKGINAVLSIAKWFGRNKKVADALGIGLGILAGTIVAGTVVLKAYTFAQKMAAIMSGEARAKTLLQVAALGVVKLAHLAGAAATGVATAAQWAFNAAMDGNPIMIVILAIAALVAIIVLLLTHWRQVTAFLTSAWKKAIAFVVEVGKGLGKWWTNLWSTISAWVKKIFGEAVQWVQNAFRNTLDFFINIGTGIRQVWTKMWSGLGSIVRGAFSEAISIVKGSIDLIIGAINSVVKGINGMTGLASAIGIKIPKIPTIPSLDVGGRIPGSTNQPVLMIGHGGEEVLSNDMLSGRAPLPARAVAAVMQSVTNTTPAAGSSGGASRASGNSVTVNAFTNASPVQIASEVGWQLRRMA